MNYFLPHRQDIVEVLREEGLDPAQSVRIADKLTSDWVSEYDRASMPLEVELDSYRKDDKKSLEVLGAAMTLAFRKQIAESLAIRHVREAIIEFLQCREGCIRIPKLVRETMIALNPFTPLLTPTEFVQKFVKMLPDAGIKGKRAILYYDPALQTTILLEWPDHEITTLLIKAITYARSFGLSEDRAATLVLTNWMEDVPLISATYRKPTKGPSVGYFQLTFAECLPVKEIKRAVDVLRFRSKAQGDSSTKDSETRSVAREKVPSLRKLSLFVDAEAQLNPDVLARQRFKSRAKTETTESKDQVSISETRAWFANYLSSNRQSGMTEYFDMLRRTRPAPWVGTLSVREREVILDARLRMYDSQRHEDVTELTFSNMAGDQPWIQLVTHEVIHASELESKVRSMHEVFGASNWGKYMASITRANVFIDQMLKEADERDRYCNTISFDELKSVVAKGLNADDEDAQYEIELAKEQESMRRAWAKPYDDRVFRAFSCLCRPWYICYHLASVVSCYAQSELDELAVALAKMVVSDECNCRGAIVHENGQWSTVVKPYWCSVASWPDKELPTRYRV